MPLLQELLELTGPKLLLIRNLLAHQYWVSSAILFSFGRLGRFSLGRGLFNLLHAVRVLQDFL